MTSKKISNIIEELKTITLLEAAELVKTIEEVFGVDASSGSGMMMVGNLPTTNSIVEEVEEIGQGADENASTNESLEDKQVKEDDTTDES